MPPRKRTLAKNNSAVSKRQRKENTEPREDTADSPPAAQKKLPVKEFEMLNYAISPARQTGVEFPLG
ncbi:hypothetical protein J3B02_001450, partial [Coemansia erecta]